MESVSHLDIQTFLLQIAVLLFAARILGQISIKLGQPAVIGEILAGVLLGPSLFGVLFPEISANFLPSSSAQLHLLEGISLIGVLFLLFVTGLEIDLALIYRQIRAAIGIPLGGGLILPLIAGFTFGYLLPEVYLVSEEQRIETACFFAIATGISAIPVIARVLMELGITRRNVSQTLFAAAMIDDAVGWILLSALIGLISSGTFDVNTVTSSLISVLGLTIGSLTIGRIFVSKFIDLLFSKGLSSNFLSYTISLLFLWGWFSQLLHLEALFGAFVLGILFSMIPRVHGESLHTIETITSQFFAPLFFSLAGLKINLQALGNREFFILAIIYILLSISSKFIGVYSGARLFGKQDHWSAIFFASALNARGSMGVIVASIGLSLGVITEEIYAVLVLMAVLTSIIAPPALRYSVQKITPTEEELRRLEKEQLASDSLLHGVKRVLIPLRPRPIDTFDNLKINEIDIINTLNKSSNIDTTLMSVYSEEKPNKTQDFIEHVASQIPSKVNKVITHGPMLNVGDLILDELKKGYDLMLLGVAAQRSPSKLVFNSVVDYVIRMSNCPVILAQGELPDINSPHGIKILIPTGGSVSAKKATELSFNFLNNKNSELYFLKVIEENEHTNETTKRRQLFFGKQVLNEFKDYANAHGISPITQLQVGPDPETVILETIIRKEIDLLILGTRVRPVGERLYLGPRIERLLNKATCPVIILNT